jgi:hypothetical protein
MVDAKLRGKACPHPGKSAGTGLESPFATACQLGKRPYFKHFWVRKPRGATPRDGIEIANCGQEDRLPNAAGVAWNRVRAALYSF